MNLGLKNGKIRIKLSSVLQIGLGGVFIYAGASIVTTPGRWTDFLPQWISLPDQTLLVTYGVIEMVLGIALLIGIFLPVFSLVAFLNLLLVMIFTGITDATFGNFGLSMAALGLFISSMRIKQEKDG